SAFRHLFANHTFLLVLALVLAGQWVIVTFGGQMFRTVPLSLAEWGWIMLLTSPVLWCGELVRVFKGKKVKG
ncbi:MAG: cation transporting ATPase C-terminal domain-containing protein, partial [Prevotellaceae bacterium]|nr:cation transporting ATPase C-terminal domain-containing protein [Prevotellaceae bacterium]